MANVTVIPATKALHSKLPINTRARRRVAGYARVSTDSEEQLTSYEAQVSIIRIPLGRRRRRTPRGRVR